jgi:AraC-like DNA-binding protein
MNHREAKRKAQRIQTNREELVESIARILPEDGSFEAFDGFFLGRSSKPMEYEDPSYFSREYKRLFGAPPQRDIVKLRSNLEL